MKESLRILLDGAKDLDILTEDAMTVARALRLSTILRFIQDGVLSKDEGLGLVDGRLSVDNPDTYYDDRPLLENDIFKFQQYGTLNPEIIELIDRIIATPSVEEPDVFPEYGCTPPETFWERLVRWFKHLFKTKKDII